MVKSKKVLLSILVGVLFVTAYGVWQEENLLAVWQSGSIENELDEQAVGTYYTLYDQDTNVVLEYMSRNVAVGDELITGDNKHYRIVRVDGLTAYCQLLQDKRLQAFRTEGESAPAASFGKNFQAVAIYCTHTDECYVPTSGTESKNGGGDILEVAETIVEVLESRGVKVIHSENIHDPHDANAYQRSRKTASELLQGAPAAMIDVHRDGIPDPEYYATEIEGEPATQIRLVVGRQNQNSEANIEFAEKMKQYYDEVKPGLIKSIYMAKGNYNQDLAPHSILLEIGTHTNSLEEAKVGAENFAQVLPEFLGIRTNDSSENTVGQEVAEKQGTAEESSGGMGKSILWLLGFAVIGGAAFMFISRGSFGK